MKKIKMLLCCLLTTALLAGVISGISLTAFAAVSEEECDAVFFKTLEETLIYDGKVTTENSIMKEMVYDFNLEPLGYVYSIEFESSEGYAIAINNQGIYEVTEIFLDAQSPYQDYSGAYIYINNLMYLVWDNETYYETSTGIALDEETLGLFAEKAFYASGAALYLAEETVYYTNRVQNEYALAKRLPAYFPVGISNGCTPAAGGNIIGYYTRFYQELIPGFTPGTAMGNYYLYKEMPAEATGLIQTLSTYMGTNSIAPGTTIKGFEDGLIQFCSEKNRNISFESCMQNGVLDFAKAKLRFQAGLPSALFVDTFTVGTLSNWGDEEIIKYIVGGGCHAMAGFGFNEITYTLSNGSVRADKYIVVASGLVDKSKGYFNINNNTLIDEYYSVNIY